MLDPGASRIPISHCSHPFRFASHHSTLSMFWTEMTLKRAKRHVCGGEGGADSLGPLGHWSCLMLDASPICLCRRGGSAANPAQHIPGSQKHQRGRYGVCHPCSFSDSTRTFRWLAPNHALSDSHHGLAITGAANAGMTQHYSVPATKQAPCKLV